MNSIAIERAIKNVAKKHVDVRQGMQSKDRMQRQQAALLMQHIANFMRGFFFAIELSLGAEKAEYYRQFYRQARSAKGFNETTKKVKDKKKKESQA